MKLNSITKLLVFAVTAMSLLVCACAGVRADTIGYVANIETAVGNPVTDLLILEEDSTGLVHASVFGADLPGFGTSVISHDPGFAPSNSLILGLTEGVDAAGAPKTQIIAFLDDDFAAANVGRKWSDVFVGSRHSLTINSLMAAVAGDMAEQAWFTDTFYPGPAAGAAFATGGTFTVAEFTELNIAGSSAVNGNWMINSLGETFLSGQTGGGRDAFVIDETAKVDLGPFDIELALNIPKELGVDKTVLNDTGARWQQFVLELGTTVGGEFFPSTVGDGLTFVDTANFPVREETGAFPSVMVEEDRVVFNGQLDDAQSAHFIVFIDSNTMGAHKFTLRQYAVVPEPATCIVLLIGMMTMLSRRDGVLS